MNRWRLLTIGKMDVYLHPGMLLYVGYALIIGHGTFMTAAVFSILLHEMAHAAVAFILGHIPSSIEITPLGALLRLDEESLLKPPGRVIMLLAGPLMTFFLCHVVVILSIRGVISTDFGETLFLCNLAILVLNLIPALPLDGGRLLSVLLGLFLPEHVVYRIMRTVGNCIGIGLIVLNAGVSLHLGGWNLSLAFAGCCLLYSAATASTTRAMAELRWLMDRKIKMEQKGSRHTLLIAAQHTQTLRQLIRTLPRRKMAVYLCIESGSMKPVGWMSEDILIQHYLQHPEMRFIDAMKQEL